VLLQHPRASEHRSPAVTIPSTTWCFMIFLKKAFGGVVSSKRPSKKHHSKSWNWSVRYNAAIDLLRRVLPYMKHPEKIRRAKLLVLHYKEVTNRGGHYTPELLRRKHKFERAFFCRSTKTHV
jgi:hypothetical protein